MFELISVDVNSGTLQAQFNPTRKYALSQSSYLDKVLRTSELFMRLFDSPSST